MSTKLMGMLLSICGNCLIAGSLNLQKYVHLQNEKLPEAQQTAYHKSSTWWIGLLLMICGEMGNFTSFSLAPVHIVAPLGAVSVIANAVLAAYFLQERIRRRDIYGIACAVVGTSIIVISSPEHDPKITAHTLLSYMASGVFILYMLLILATIAYLLKLRPELGTRYVLINVGICSLLGSITVMSSKGVSTFLRLTFDGHSQLGEPIFYILIAIAAFTAVTQVRYLNDAMASFGSTEVVPVYYVTFTMASILAGIVLYREFSQISLFQLLGFALGCAFTFAGVYLITSNRREQPYQIIPSEEEVLELSNHMILDVDDKPDRPASRVTGSATSSPASTSATPDPAKIPAHKLTVVANDGSNAQTEIQDSDSIDSARRQLDPPATQSAPNTSSPPSNSSPASNSSAERQRLPSASLLEQEHLFDIGDDDDDDDMDDFDPFRQ